MAKYKVVTLAMAVKHNRIARFGEMVDDSELTLNPSELIKEGFIEEIESEKIVLEALETETETETEKVEESKEELEVSEEEAEKPKELSKKEEVKAKLAKK